MLKLIKIIKILLNNNPWTFASKTVCMLSGFFFFLAPRLSLDSNMEFASALLAFLYFFSSNKMWNIEKLGQVKNWKNNYLNLEEYQLLALRKISANISTLF